MEQERKPTHPGVILLEEVIRPLGMSITKTALHLGVSRKALSELVNERVALSPEMAIRIARVTETSAQSWLEMQMKLDLWESEAKQFNVIPFKQGVEVFP